MKQNIILISILLLLIDQANTKVLKRQQNYEKLQVFLEIEKDEETIEFFNNQSQQSDQITCRLSDCSCQFTQENEHSGQIHSIECEGNNMSFFRTNNNVKESRRITAETYTDSDMLNSLTISSSLTLKWKFNNDGTIEFATIWKRLSWLGIGFGSNMKNTDMIAINVSGQTVNLIDLYSTSDTTPSTDSSQDLKLISYSVGTSSVSTRFSRKLSTGDTKDLGLTVGSTYSWCYAYSSALQMERHSNTAVFTFTLSNSTSATNQTSTSTPTETETSDDEEDSETGSEDSGTKAKQSTSIGIMLLLQSIPLLLAM